MDTKSANPGFIRPPVIFLFSIITGFIIDNFWIIKIDIGMMSIPIGILLLVLGVTLFALTHREFKKSKTPIPGNKPTSAIICSGPFKISRNPIYLAFVIIQLSIVFLSQNMWVLVMLIPALVLVQSVVIPREEKYMENMFNNKYTAYKSSVRQWL